MAVGKEKAGNWALGKAAKLKVPFAKGRLDRRLYAQSNANSGYHTTYGYGKPGEDTPPKGELAENYMSRGRGAGYFERRRAKRSTARPTTSTEGGTDETPRVGIIRRAGQGVGRFGRRIIGRPDRDERGSSTPTIFGRGKPKSESPSTPETAKVGTDYKMHSTVAPGASGHIGEGQGSVQKRQDGAVTITGPVTATGHVTIAGGANTGAAKQGFIGKKYDEYLGRLQKAGEKPIGSKQNITIHLEEMLKDKGPEDISKMHEPEWERFFKEAEEKEKGKTEGGPQFK